MNITSLKQLRSEFEKHDLDKCTFEELRSLHVMSLDYMDSMPCFHNGSNYQELTIYQKNWFNDVMEVVRPLKERYIATVMAKFQSEDGKLDLDLNDYKALTAYFKRVLNSSTSNTETIEAAADALLDVERELLSKFPVGRQSC